MYGFLCALSKSTGNKHPKSSARCKESWCPRGFGPSAFSRSCLRNVFLLRSLCLVIDLCSLDISSSTMGWREFSFTVYSKCKAGLTHVVVPLRVLVPAPPTGEAARARLRLLEVTLISAREGGRVGRGRSGCVVGDVCRLIAEVERSRREVCWPRFES